MVDLPESIGRYRVDGVVGSGGFATVYRAYDERFDATVAVKVLAENHCLDPDVRERFLKEGRVLRRVGSPHLVTAHDLGENDRGQPYLVLDFADRGTLAERVQACRADAGWRPTVGDVRNVVEAIADGLAAVHASDLVHRDVTPGNLLLRSVRTATTARAGLVRSDERLLLADLGLSKDLAAASGLTIGGGTAGFTPPEQRSGMGRVDATADIWAASAVVVWLLLGHPPDDDGRWQAELAAADWSDPVVATLAQGLADEPGRRHGDAATWFAALEAALVPPAVTEPAVTEPLRPGPPAPAPPLPAPPLPPTAYHPGAAGPAPGRRRAPRALALLLAALLGGGAVLAATLLLDDGPDDADPTVEALSGGDVRVEVAQDDRTVAIVGPREVAVGATTTFAAETDGVDRSLWIGPDGGLHVDVAQIEVTAESPGLATVRLIGIDGQGRQVEVSHDLHVVE
jgi:tRNA A-37 threonylcarbamoyl transferase component Bud32